MDLNIMFIVIFFIGIFTQLFYNPAKTRAWILNKIKGTFLYPQNTLQRMSLEMLLIIPTYLNWLVKFGIIGFMIFKSYDIIGFQKTLLIMIILIYVSVTTSKSNTVL